MTKNLFITLCANILIFIIYQGQTYFCGIQFILDLYIDSCLSWICAKEIRVLLLKCWPE